MSRRVETPRQQQPPRRPASCCRPWSCPASVPIAGNDSRRQARIAEADRRRPREAQTTPDTRLAVRGIVPASLDRGRRPPQGGKPSAAVLSPSSLERKTPRSVLGGFADRAAPVPRGESVRSAKHTSTARRTHHRPRPPRQAQRTSTAQGTRKQGTRAWRGGVESPRSRRWGNATHHANADRGNAAEPSLGQARHEPTPTPPRRAQEQRQFSHRVGTSIALALGRG